MRNFIAMNNNYFGFQQLEFKLPTSIKSTNKDFFMNSGICTKVIRKVRTSPLGHQYVNAIVSRDDIEKIFLIGFEGDFDYESALLLEGKEVKLIFNNSGELIIKYFSTLPKNTREFILNELDRKSNASTKNSFNQIDNEENIFQSKFNYLANEILIWILEWLVFSKSYQKNKNQKSQFK